MGKRVLAVVVVIASACTALHYSWTQQAAVVISNNPYTFDGGGTQMFVISPVGSADDYLQSIETDNCSSQWHLDTKIDPQQPVMGARVCSAQTGSGSGNNFAACPANYQFAVRFEGTQPGTSSCNVKIEYMPAGSSIRQTAILSLTGIGSAGSGFEATPAAIQFGGVVVGMSSNPPVTVTVKNLGSAAQEIKHAFTTGGFVVTPPTTQTVTIGGGSAASYHVQCSPIGLGKRTGLLRFMDTSNVMVASTELECVGIESTISIQPTHVVFEDTLVGRQPPEVKLQITGPSTAVIGEIQIDEAASQAGVQLTRVPNPGTMVGSGQEVTLTYAASTPHPGGPLGTLYVPVSTDPDPREVAITGQALVGGVGTNPASVQFGAVCVGAMATKDVEVYASEPGDITISGMEAPSPPFSLEILDDLPAKLLGNHLGPSVFARITMSPTAGGEIEDVLKVESDVPARPTIEVRIHGVGIEAGIAATPDRVQFGTAKVGSTTSIREVQLSNCGTDDLSFEKAEIVGPDGAEFTLIGANPPRTLAPSESETFMVVMQPKSPGAKTAQLVLTHSKGSTTAQLDGIGEGRLGDRETYYACSTGRGTPAWPLALALFAACRRRRGGP